MIHTFKIRNIFLLPALLLSIALPAIAFENENTPPSISGEIGEATVGEKFVFSPQISDADGDKIKLTISNRPKWLTFYQGGTLTGTPGEEDIGTSKIITIIADDGIEKTRFKFNVTVKSANNAPVITGDIPEATVGETFTFTPSISDPDGDEIKLAISNNMPKWLRFYQNGTLTGTPEADDIGTSKIITIYANDGTDKTTFKFTITVNPANNAPVITGDIPEATVGETFTFTPSISDPDGDEIKLAISNNMPKWLRFYQNGTLTGTPEADDIGTSKIITIYANDGTDKTSFKFTIIVNPANNAPVITGDIPEATVGEIFTFTPSISDPDGDTIQLTISNRPTWLKFYQGGRLTGTPTIEDIGTSKTITIIANDGNVKTRFKFSITVKPAVVDVPSIEEFTVEPSDITEESITLNWQHEDENVVGFDLLRDGEFISTFDMNTLTFTDENLSPEQTYSYSLHAFYENQIRSEAFIIQATTLPMTAPSNEGLTFEAIASTTTSVTLQWHHTDTKVTGYELFRDGDLLNTIMKEELNDFISYVDENLLPNNEYTYSISAFNAYELRAEPVAITTTTIENHTPIFSQPIPQQIVTNTLNKDQVIVDLHVVDEDVDPIEITIISGNDKNHFAINDEGALVVGDDFIEAGGHSYYLRIVASDGFAQATNTVKVSIIASEGNNKKQGIYRDYYKHSSISDLASLKNYVDFPNKPTSTTVENNFQSPSNVNNLFGQRMHGYLVPKVTGEYTFWISARDDGELWLSENSNASSAKLIAYTNGSTTDWDANDSQQSATFTLQAGKPYYISALMADYYWSDDLAVAWQGPGFEREIITGDYLHLLLDTESPTTPSNLRSSKTANDTVILEWNGSTDNEGVTSYLVFENGQLKATTTDLVITFSELGSDERYKYTVVATDEVGNLSAESAAINVVINDYQAPSAPSYLTATTINTRSLSIEWTASIDEHETPILYQVFVDQTLVGNTYSTEYTIEDLTPDTDYTISVKALDVTGNIAEGDAPILITTLSIDSATPEFSSSNYEFGVAANAAIGTTIGQVLASDPNDETLTYSITSENENFQIDNNGMISIAKTFTTDLAQNIKLTVEASNGHQSVEKNVLVNVITSTMLAQNGLTRSLWTDKTGSILSLINLDETPNVRNLTSQFSAPSLVDINYSQYIRGYLRPKTSGTYSFWVASDNASELRLSTDMGEGNAVVINKVENYVAQNNWKDRFQTKTDIQLQAGQLYYIDVLHKANYYSNHLSVAWQGGNITEKTAIDSDYFIPYSALIPTKPLINKAVQSSFETSGNTIEITFTISELSAGTPIRLFYGTLDGGSDANAWQNYIDLGELPAGEHTFTIPDIETGEAYFMSLAATNELATSWSATTRFDTVVIDNEIGEALPQTISLDVNVNGETKLVELKKHSVRSANFKLYTFDNRRVQQFKEVIPLPEVRTYRGVISNDQSLVASAVVDAFNTLYLSIWNGERRIWTTEIDITDQVATDVLGNAMSTNEDVLLEINVPVAENNRYFTPQPGDNFYNNLGRLGFTYVNQKYEQAAFGNLIEGLAQIENQTNETDYLWAQKTGLRWEVAHATIEEYGSVGEATQEAPTKIDAHNFSVDLQSSPREGTYCLGGGYWVGAVPKYNTQGCWDHEIGHNFGLGHGEAVDVSFHTQATGGQLSAMQARSTISRIQSGSRFKTAKALTNPMLPAAFKDYLTVYANESGEVAPLANDYDVNGDELSIIDFDATTEQGGQVTKVGDKLRYTPPANYVGTDQFTYTVSDGYLKTTGPIQVQVLKKGLAGFWDMEQSSNDAIIDKSGLNLNLFAKDKTAADYMTTGINGNGFNYPLVADSTGKNDAIGQELLPHVFDPGYKSFTASMWFKYNDITESKILMGKSHTFADELNYGGWEIRNEDSNLVMEIAFRDKLMIDNKAKLSATDVIKSNTWHHVVMVIDREKNLLKGYLDGKLITETVSLPESQGPIMSAMGYRSYSGGSPLLIGDHTDGSSDNAVDNARIYHKALSEAEVIELFNNKR